MMTGDDALKQASHTSNEYAEQALKSLMKMLGLKPSAKLSEQLAPFAPVWAAMIAAAAQDLATTTMAGYVSGGGLRIKVEQAEPFNVKVDQE